MELKSIAWALALFSGFLAKLVFEIAEMLDAGKRITWLYFLINFCKLFITFAVGYYSKEIIRHVTNNTDIQAGLFAIVGAAGYTIFSVIYKMVTSKRNWQNLIRAALSRYLSTPKDDNQTPKL
jgi:hypothetical protein